MPSRLLPTTWNLVAVSALVALVPVVRAMDWTPAVTTTGTWNSNLTNSDRAADRIGGWEIGLQLKSNGRQTITGDDTLLAGLELAGNSPWDFAPLDAISLQPSLGWEHKFGLGAYAPVAVAKIAAVGTSFRESDRSGLGGSASLTGRLRLGAATRLDLSDQYTRFNARNTVFDRSANEAAVTLRQTAGTHWHLTAEARLRHGDVVSHGTPPRPDIVAEARAFTSVNTFGTARTAYSLHARTVAGAAALAYQSRTLLLYEVRYEQADTRRGALKYVNRLVSASVSRYF